MAKLSWNDVGERIFEVGVDRAVLYNQSGIGVPWNGLVAVKENPSGGEAEPYYIDGVKYLNVSGLEEFGGSIEAYTYPDEFAPCEGVVEVGDGLFVHQQERESFGLSYRTLVGNDLEGIEFGYKIHLVYGALAEPTSKDNQTVGAEIDPDTFSWDFTTTPVIAVSNVNLAPLSHITIDSTKTSTTVMAMVEAYLYGTANSEPTLMTLQQLFDLFENPPLSLKIDADYENGLSPLIPDRNGDLTGDTFNGLYTTAPDSRLVETSQPGLYILE